MATRKRLPVKYPSVPDRESGPTQYNEPALPAAEDRVPSSQFVYTASKADLRLQLERLLERKEAGSADDWAGLGPDARGLLVELLEDDSIRSQHALLHRLIAVVGQLSIKRSVPRLVDLLVDEATSTLTRAYAANALGRIGEPAAIDALARAVSHKDDMVRRQVAMALGRIERDVVVPHLVRLQQDGSIAVAEVAAEALQRWEKKLGQRLGTRSKPATAKRSKKKTLPAAERKNPGKRPRR